MTDQSDEEDKHVPLATIPKETSDISDVLEVFDPSQSDCRTYWLYLDQYDNRINLRTPEGPRRSPGTLRSGEQSPGLPVFGKGELVEPLVHQSLYSFPLPSSNLHPGVCHGWR